MHGTKEVFDTNWVDILFKSLWSPSSYRAYDNLDSLSLEAMSIARVEAILWASEAGDRVTSANSDGFNHMSKDSVDVGLQRLEMS